MSARALWPHNCWPWWKDPLHEISNSHTVDSASCKFFNLTDMKVNKPDRPTARVIRATDRPTDWPIYWNTMTVLKSTAQLITGFLRLFCYGFVSSERKKYPCIMSSNEKEFVRGIVNRLTYFTIGFHPLRLNSRHFVAWIFRDVKVGAGQNKSKIEVHQK